MEDCKPPLTQVKGASRRVRQQFFLTAETSTFRPPSTAERLRRFGAMSQRSSCSAFAGHDGSVLVLGGFSYPANGRFGARRRVPAAPAERRLCERKRDRRLGTREWARCADFGPFAQDGRSTHIPAACEHLWHLELAHLCGSRPNGDDSSPVSSVDMAIFPCQSAARSPSPGRRQAAPLTNTVYQVKMRDLAA